MATTNSSNRSLIRGLVAVIVLALVLVSLSALYFLLTRPAQISGGQAGSQDRRFLFSIYGFQGDLLRRPTGVAFDDSGNIYVADTGKRRVVIFDGSGNYIANFGGDPGKGKNQVWQPISVAVAPDGRAYVIDKGLKKMVIYDAQHRPVNEVVFPEDPTGVQVANGNLFVTTRSGVVIGTLDGKFLTGYVKWGKDPGSFDMPGNVGVGSDGTLYVADSLNYRVQALSAQGKVKWVYGKPVPPNQAVMYQGTDRKFGLPSQLAVDGQGYVYVVDGLSSQVVVLDKEGKLVETLGDVGHADGTFYYPDGIAYHDGRIAVADKFNDRVEVFSAPMTPALADQLRLNPAWALLLLLIPLAALPFFLRRQSRYVMAPSFLEVLNVDTQNGPAVVRALKRVNAGSDFVAEHEKDVEGLAWLRRDYDAAEASGLMERFGIDHDHATALLVASKMGDKATLLLNDEPLRKAAHELGVKVLTYREVRDTVAGSSTPAGSEA